MLHERTDPDHNQPRFLISLWLTDTQNGDVIVVETPMGPGPAEQGRRETLIGQEEHVMSRQGREYEQE